MSKEKKQPELHAQLGKKIDVGEQVVRTLLFYADPANYRVSGGRMSSPIATDLGQMARDVVFRMKAEQAEKEAKATERAKIEASKCQTCGGVGHSTFAHEGETVFMGCKACGGTGKDDRDKTVQCNLSEHDSFCYNHRTFDCTKLGEITNGRWPDPKELEAIDAERRVKGV